MGRNELIADFMTDWLGEWHAPLAPNSGGVRKVISSHLQQLKKYFLLEQTIDVLVFLGLDLAQVNYHRAEDWPLERPGREIRSRYFPGLIPQPYLGLVMMTKIPLLTSNPPLLIPSTFRMYLTTNSDDSDEGEDLWRFTDTLASQESVCQWFQDSTLSPPTLNALTRANPAQCNIFRAQVPIRLPLQFPPTQTSFCICNFMKCDEGIEPRHGWWSKTTYYIDGDEIDPRTYGDRVGPKRVEILETRANAQALEVPLGSGFWPQRIGAMVRQRASACREAQEDNPDSLLRTDESINNSLSSIVAVQQIFNSDPRLVNHELDASGRIGFFDVLDDASTPYTIIEWHFNHNTGDEPSQIHWWRLKPPLETPVGYEPGSGTRDILASQMVSSSSNAVSTLASSVSADCINLAQNDTRWHVGPTGGNYPHPQVTSAVMLDDNDSLLQPDSTLLNNGFKDDACTDHSQLSMRGVHAMPRYLPSPLDSDVNGRRQSHLLTLPTLFSNDTDETAQSGYHTPQRIFEEDTQMETEACHDPLSQRVITDDTRTGDVPRSKASGFGDFYQLDSRYPRQQDRSRAHLQTYPQFPMCSPELLETDSGTQDPSHRPLFLQQHSFQMLGEDSGYASQSFEESAERDFGNEDNALNMQIQPQAPLPTPLEEDEFSFPVFSQEGDSMRMGQHSQDYPVYPQAGDCPPQCYSDTFQHEERALISPQPFLTFNSHMKHTPELFDPFKSTRSSSEMRGQFSRGGDRDFSAQRLANALEPNFFSELNALNAGSNGSVNVNTQAAAGAGQNSSPAPGLLPSAIEE
ncbi:MAG: hypothetical protein M1828_002941 [Chrysothrix sp. TS-e1954]|nr:MAG: hypothetical protein M1828_002941 [Chrysothrix sp. TS-e1954]